MRLVAGFMTAGLVFLLTYASAWRPGGGAVLELVLQSATVFISPSRFNDLAQILSG